MSEQKGDKSATGEVGSGFAAQYKKLAIVVYDQLIQDFERCKSCVFEYQE